MLQCLVLPASPWLVPMRVVYASALLHVCQDLPRRRRCAALPKGADAVVVGSVLVTTIAQSLDKDGHATGKTVPAVLELVETLAQGLRQG